jgi:cytochrome c556
MRPLACAFALLSLTGLAGCTRTAALAPIGSVKDLMQHEVDPAADALWDSVSIVVDAGGIHENQPRSDADWAQVRGAAVNLAEGANLLMIKGRALALPGQELNGAGAPGNLTTAEATQALEKNQDQFLGFARALQLIAVQALEAADSRNVKRLMDTGEALDNACEACHLKFWYPPSAST